MSDIKTNIKGFSDEFLLDEFYHNKEEYTDEALALMDKEISIRRLSPELLKKAQAHDEVQKAIDLTNEEFVPFEHSFYQTDLLLAQAVLRDNKIPFLVDSTNSSDVLPLESEAMQSFAIHVPASLLDQAHALIDEHFNKENGFYSVRYSGIKERLKLLTFTEIPLTEKQLSEEVEVQFSPEEITALIPYLKKLPEEADEIETKMDRVVFYFDNLEECLANLTKKGQDRFSRMDLLTILEVLQIYCDASDFPQVLENTAEALLTFFNV